MRSYNRLYNLLNVLPDADPVVIEAAYKALIKKHHPDKHGDEQGAAEKRAAEINQAYAVLRDPERRAAYDTEEGARRERNRVELARLNQAQPASQPGEDGRRTSNGGKPPVRTEQRLAAWAGVLGAAVLTAALFLFARGSTELRATSPAASVAASAETARLPAGGDMLEQDELAFSDLPVNRRTVSDAVAEFRQISARGGLQAAADFSERCFEGQRRTRGIGDFDYCVAFDYAATRADLAPPKDGQEQVARFQPQALLARHVGAADRLSSDETLIEARLFEIRRLADAALVEFGYPAAAEASKIRTAAATISPPPSRRSERPRAQPAKRVPAPRPVRQRSQQRAEDFLEREGGIY